MWRHLIAKAVIEILMLTGWLLCYGVVLSAQAIAGESLNLDTGTATSNNLIIDVIGVKGNLNGSTTIYAKVYNAGQADAIINVLNASGERVNIPTLISGLRPYNSVMKILSTPITEVQLAADSFSGVLPWDTRSVANSQRTEVEINVPRGGSFKLTKNNKWAVRYNILTTGLDLLGNLLDGMDANTSKELFHLMLAKDNLALFDIYIDKFLKKQLTLSDIAKFTLELVKNTLPLLDTTKIASGTPFAKFAKLVLSKSASEMMGLLKWPAWEAEAFTFALTIQDGLNGIAYDTTISYVDRNLVGGNGSPVVNKPVIFRVNPDLLQEKSVGVQTITILGLGFTRASTVNFTFDDLSGGGPVDVEPLSQPRFISQSELKYDIAVGSTPGKWAIAVDNNGLLSNQVEFNVFATSGASTSTAPPAPIGLASFSGAWSHRNHVALNWVNPQSSTGISKVWWKIGNAPISDSDGNVAPISYAKPLQISLPITAGQQDVHVWLENGAGQHDYLNRATIRLGVDVAPPDIDITSQVEADTTQESIKLSGTFNDELSGVTQVTWNNDSVDTGDALINPGLSGSWTTPAISLYSGINVIEVTAIDSAGNSTSRKVTIRKSDATNSGSVEITVSPAEAAAAGAKWRLNGGAWHLSGETELNVPAGVAQVDFEGVGYYIAPQSHPVIVGAGQVSQRTESFPLAVVNVPPYTPSNPYPANGAVDISRVNPTFSWTGGGPVGGVSYHFMMSDNPDPNDHNQCDIGFGVTAGSSVSCMQTLEAGKTYYWEVAARDGSGATTTGPVWSFSTEYAMPDLIVSSMELEGNVIPGANLTLNVTVKNIGNFPTYGTTYVRAYLSSTAGTKSVGLTPKVPGNVPVLQPGDTQTFSIPVTLTGLQSGTSYLDVWLDSTQGGQVEANSDNNLRSIPINYLDGQAPLITNAGLQDSFVKTGISDLIYYTATDDTGIRTVDFYYSEDDGANWLPIQEGYVSTSPPKYGATYLWNVPKYLPIISNLKIRVVARDAYGNAGEFIAGPYTVHDGTAPIVTVVSPSGGETWSMGSTQTIQWTATAANPIVSTTLDFFHDGTNEYIGNINGPGDGSFSWTLHNNFSTTSGKVRISVQDANGNYAEDFSDGVFSVHDTSAPPPAPWVTPQPIITVPASQTIMSVQLATDASGDLHMAYLTYSDDLSDPRIITQTVHYRKLSGGVWSADQSAYSIAQTTDFNLTGYYGIGDLQLAVSNAGIPYIAWERGYNNSDITENNKDDIYMTYIDGGNWSAPFNVSEDLPGSVGTTTESMSPRIKVDSADNVHIVWADGLHWNADFTTTGQQNIYYKEMASTGVWGSTIKISDISRDDPDLSINSNGTLELVFRGNVSGSPVVSYTSNSGSGWTSPAVISSGDDIGNVRIVSDNNDHLHVIWSNWDNNAPVNNAQLFYSYFDGTTWSAKDLITSTVSIRQAAVSVDSHDRPHVTWEELSYPQKLFYSYRSGDQWSTPIQLHYDSQIVVDNTSDSALSMSDNEMYVAWVSQINGVNTILENQANVGSTIDTFAPTVSIIAPTANENLSVGSSYNIRWDAVDNIGISGVDLHYSTDNGVTWVLIAKNQPNTGTYSMVIPADAKFQIRVTAHDAASNIGVGYSSTATTSDSMPPVISLTAPTSAAPLDAGSTINVNWVASDNVAVTAIDLSSSVDSGASWQTITSGLSDTSSYAWVVPDTLTSALLIRVIAHDAAGYTAVATSTQPLVIERANIVPFTPSTPYPLTDNANVPINSPALQWQSGDADGDALTYQILLGTDPNPSLFATTSNNYIALGALLYSTKYYWQVVVSDGKASASGPVWTFTTESQPPAPQLVDTDGDGIPDEWEIANLGNLTTADNSTDTDGDGLLDKDEYKYGTNPNQQDSDGDGVTDGEEILYGTNPLLITDTLDSHRPYKPVINPIEGGASLHGQAFDVAVFSDPDQPSDYLMASEWQISVSKDFSAGNIIYDKSLLKGSSTSEVDYRQLKVPDGVLIKATAYWVRARHEDKVGLWSAWSDTATFITQSVDPNDQDNNGVDDRYQISGNTDINNDGIVDKTEGIIALNDAEDNSMTIGVGADSGAIGGLTSLPTSSIPTNELPTGSMPYGLFNFRIDGLPVDAANPASTKITFYFPSSMPADAKWYKYDSVNNVMSDYTNNVEFNGNEALVTLTDGGDGDADGVVNGVIIDPGGPVLPAAIETGGSNSNGSTNNGSNNSGTNNNGNGAGGNTSVGSNSGGGGGNFGPLFLMLMLWLVVYRSRLEYTSIRRIVTRPAD